MLSASAGPVLARWSTLFEEYQTSALDFYARVEQALKRRQVPNIKLRRVEWKEGGLLSARREYLRVERGKHVFDICAAPFGTGFFFSSWLAKPRSPYGFLYLVGIVLLTFIAWGFLLAFVGIFMRNAGAFGILIYGGFLSFLLLMAALWGLGYAISQGNFGDEEVVIEIPVVGLLYAWAFPTTYYRADTAIMFRQLVHNAVLEVIDELTTVQGLRALSAEERKPVLRGLLEG